MSSADQVRLHLWMNRLQAIAQNGLHYSQDVYDQERYQQIMTVAAEMGQCMGDNIDVTDVEQRFLLEQGPATPKLDVRAFITKDDQLLLVRETTDGLWSLPGGWAEVNESACRSVVREVQEETGLNVTVTRLVALWDKLMHDHPPEWPHALKAVFQCNIIGGQLATSHETSEVTFFDFSALPALSLPRITPQQITLARAVVEKNLPPYLD